MGKVDVPDEVRRLVAEREQARKARDFTRADTLRDEIARLGFEVRDTASGVEVVPKATFEAVLPTDVPFVLDVPAEREFSVHLLYEGFRDDVERFLAGLLRHCADRDYEVVIVDNASNDGEWLEAVAGTHDRVRVVHLSRAVGWAQARNAGMKTSAGRVVVLADLSIEPTGDVLAPLADALADDAVGVAGPFGLVSDDLREFKESGGPEVDAIEGYLLATRRELLGKGGLIDEKFKWYRHADIDFSFQLRALGTTAVVVPLPVTKHAHRGWEALDEEERAKRSKRNWYRFLDRWKHRHGMLLSHGDGTGDVTNRRPGES